MKLPAAPNEQHSSCSCLDVLVLITIQPIPFLNRRRTTDPSELCRLDLFLFGPWDKTNTTLSVVSLSCENQNTFK